MITVIIKTENSTHEERLNIDDFRTLELKINGEEVININKGVVSEKDKELEDLFDADLFRFDNDKTKSNDVEEFDVDKISFDDIKHTNMVSSPSEIKPRKRVMNKGLFRR